MLIRKSHFLVFLILAMAVFTCSCKKLNSKSLNKLTIKDIAFNVNKKSGYTIYINENSSDVPYLVLTSDYNGKALLLRKEVLDEDHIFNDYLGYYKDSLIDEFLNSDYLSTLDSKLQHIIIDSEITITTELSLGIAGTDTENIIRKIFLLSCTETGIFDTSFTGQEGETLKYFNDVESRIAYGNGIARSWWLRTSYTIHDSAAWVIFTKGEWGAAGAYEASGVRPAFCLDNTTLIEEMDNIIDGEIVYAIKE